ncbi:hypothetical protein KAR91_13560 [Candidatus Pacearchaeota archaeon]|nr:hypothetical protein [Candidatus Pacearchaeota archaeon]
MAKRNQKTRQQNKPRQQKPVQSTEYLDGKFWFGNIHIHGVGIVNGKVRTDHLEKFRAQHKRLCVASGLHADDQPKLREDYWIRDVDELELKKKRDRKKRPE